MLFLHGKTESKLELHQFKVIILALNCQSSEAYSEDCNEIYWKELKAM